MYKRDFVHCSQFICNIMNQKNQPYGNKSCCIKPWGLNSQFMIS